jgi:hypothetical protein
LPDLSTILVLNDMGTLPKRKLSAINVLIRKVTTSASRVIFLVLRSETDVGVFFIEFSRVFEELEVEGLCVEWKV